MYFKQIAVILLVLFSLVTIGCSKEKPNKIDSQTTSQDAKVVTVEFKSEGMTCSGCESTITEKVKTIDGVKEVKADSKTNLTKVTFDDKKTNKDAIEKAIVEAGYKVISSKQL